MRVSQLNDPEFWKVSLRGGDLGSLKIWLTWKIFPDAKGDLCFVTDLTVGSLQNSYVEILLLLGMVLGCEALGGWLGHKGEILKN